jgi:hypothetical protein
MSLSVGEMHAYLWRTYPPDSQEAIHHRAEAQRIWREIGQERFISKYFSTD